MLGRWFSTERTRVELTAVEGRLSYPLKEIFSLLDDVLGGIAFEHFK